MNHPDREQWMAYLYGETNPEARTPLATHLRACAECREQVEAWRRTLRTMSDWQLPSVRRRPPIGVRAVRWGIAAGLVLGVGFGLGRFTGPAAVDLDALQARLVPAVRQQVQGEIRSDLQAVLAGSPGSLTNDFQRALRQEFDQYGDRLMAAAHVVTADQLANLGETLERQRDEDRRATLALYQKQDLQRRTDYASLRKDLETVAVVADGRLQYTQEQIGRLAAYTQAEASRPSDSSTLPVNNPIPKGN